MLYVFCAGKCKEMRPCTNKSLKDSFYFIHHKYIYEILIKKQRCVGMYMFFGLVFETFQIGHQDTCYRIGIKLVLFVLVLAQRVLKE